MIRGLMKIWFICFISSVIGINSIAAENKEDIPKDKIIAAVTCDKKPLPAATVYLESLSGMTGLNKWKKTDDQGIAEFTVDSKVLYTITIIADGYRFGQEKICKPGKKYSLNLTPLPEGVKICTTVMNHCNPDFLISNVGAGINLDSAGRDKTSHILDCGIYITPRDYKVKIDGKSNKNAEASFSVMVKPGKRFKIELDGKSVTCKIVGFRKSHIIVEYENNGLVNENDIKSSETDAWYKITEEK